MTPVVEITSISKTKVGRQPGCDTAHLTFVISGAPAARWSVRVNSTGAYDGTLVASAEARNGFGRMPFGRSSFGRWAYGELPAEGEADVTAASLLHGTNDVAVYAMTSTGEWSYRL